MNQALTILSIALVALSATADVNNTIYFTIPPNGWILPVLQQDCELSQLVININYLSSTDLGIYVYPPYNVDHCDIMTMYYTALGAPTIPNAKNLTAWYVSDIMVGTTCFGIQNADTEGTAVGGIEVSMSCNPPPQDGVPMARGWYTSKPNPGSRPNIGVSSSTGTANSKSSSGPFSSAQKNNPVIFGIIGVIAATSLML